MNKEKFTHKDIEIINGTPIYMVVNELMQIMNECPTALVTIRHTAGTDFPPFVAIESRETYVKTNEEEEFPSVY